MGRFGICQEGKYMKGCPDSKASPGRLPCACLSCRPSALRAGRGGSWGYCPPLSWIAHMFQNHDMLVRAVVDSLQRSANCEARRPRACQRARARSSRTSSCKTATSRHLESFGGRLLSEREGSGLNIGLWMVFGDLSGNLSAK